MVRVFMNPLETPTRQSVEGAGNLLTKKQAAAFLGIAPRTLDDWRSAKVITCIERRGFIRFLRQDLDDFLQRHRMEARRETLYRPRGKPADHDTTQDHGSHTPNP